MPSFKASSKHAKPEELFVHSTLLKSQLDEFKLVEFGASDHLSTALEVTFNTKPQPAFNKKFDLLIENLNENHTAGFTNYIFCSTEQQAKRLNDIFEEVEETVHYKTIVFPLYQGFIDQDLKLACYTDHQIFERYHKFQLKNGYAKKQAITLKELNKLEIGDYVTHIDHGIGKFGGLQKIDVEGKKQEAIKLVYGDRDILYVSIHSLHIRSPNSMVRMGHRPKFISWVPQLGKNSNKKPRVGSRKLPLTSSKFMQNDAWRKDSNMLRIATYNMSWKRLLFMKILPIRRNPPKM